MSRDGYVWVLVLSGITRRLRRSCLGWPISPAAEAAGSTPWWRFIAVSCAVPRDAWGRPGELPEGSGGRFSPAAGAVSRRVARAADPGAAHRDRAVERSLYRGHWSGAPKTLEALRLRGADRALQSVLVRVDRAKVLASCGDVASAEAALAEALAVARKATPSTFRRRQSRSSAGCWPNRRTASNRPPVISRRRSPSSKASMRLGRGEGLDASLGMLCQSRSL